MLRRDISGMSVLIAAAGGMIGSGWLFSPFIAAQIAGPNALVSWIIAAVFMLFIALPLCELGAMFPISGGMANYPSFTHGKEVGFLFAWTMWLSYVVMTPIEIQAILQYSGRIFPSLLHSQDIGLFELSPRGYVVAIFLLFFITSLNSFGIKLLARCNVFASIIKFIIPSLAIFALISHTPDTHNVALHLSDIASWKQIFSVLSIGGVAFAFTGFQNGLMLGGEVQNPQRNLPIAILGAILIGLILYFLLQYAFIVAVPGKYLQHGWSSLGFPGESGPLVGLLLLLNLSVVAMLITFDAMFSPFGTSLVYTAATSRILYGMSEQKHVPTALKKLNRYNIPYVTLIVNFLVGAFSFLPFPGWQKMVAFLSSCSILSYGIGPICLLALRRLQPNRKRPFRLACATFLSYLAFYVSNLMLYWCGFDILWKLDVALLIGLGIHWTYKKNRLTVHKASLYWFVRYMGMLLLISYLGSFGGIGAIVFPYDAIILLPLSITMLYLSERALLSSDIHETIVTAYVTNNAMSEGSL